MTTPPSTSIATPPPYTIPEGTLIVNCLIMLTHNHEEEDGSHFLFVPSSSSGFHDPWVERAVPFKRGTAFFFNALDVHRGSGIPNVSPTGVTHPRLMAFLPGMACYLRASLPDPSSLPDRLACLVPFRPLLLLLDQSDQNPTPTQPAHNVAQLVPPDQWAALHVRAHTRAHTHPHWERDQILRCGDVHPNPGPTSLALINVTALRAHHHEVLDLQEDIVALTETRFTQGAQNAMAYEKGRDIPPGIARMLQQIRMPPARPQPLQPRREPRPNERTSRTAVLPTGPPMGFNVTSTPSPRVLSRPGQFSPSPAWSPAVTSSWHSVRHVTPDHWSPACTPGGGSNRQ